MKPKLIPIIWLCITIIVFTSCEVIGGIFKTGVGVGVFIMIVVIALVLFLVMKLRNNK